MQMDVDIGERVVGKAKGLHAERGFGFKQHHSVGSKPIRGKFEETAVILKPIRAAVERKSGFSSKDGQSCAKSRWGCMAGWSRSS